MTELDTITFSRCHELCYSLNFFLTFSNFINKQFELHSYDKLRGAFTDLVTRADHLTFTPGWTLYQIS